MADSMKINAFKQNKTIGRCVNIIGYDPLWNDWSQARMQNKHFKLIKQAGFDSVRINLHPFRHMADSSPFTLDPVWLDKLDWAVTQALDNGLGAILDLHEFHAMAKAPHQNQPRLLAFWQQISSIYHKAPNTVCYEILNEPFDELTPELWNQYLIQAHQVIRELDAQRTIIIGPGHWNGIQDLDKLILPEDDDQIIVTVHYYHPMPFTHQGAPWSSHMDAIGTEWKGTQPEKQAIIDDFSTAQVWAQAHNRPLFLGEYGAYDKADMPSRVRYTDYVARLAESLGWSWGYWQFDSDFIVYDIENDCWVQPIRDALIPKAT
jgi:endoglucanase